MSGDEVVRKERCFLLFNNMVVCAAMRKRKKKKNLHSKTELESSTGSRYVVMGVSTRVMRVEDKGTRIYG